MGVSVLIASYNCGLYIEQCLQSVINQDYIGKIEIIVCDDCSTDGSVSILNNYAKQGKIKFFKNASNAGSAEARNVCLRHATQDYIAILDADDFCHHNRFKTQVSYLDSHPDIDFVSTGLQKFYDNNTYKDIFPKKEYPTKRDFLKGLPFMHATTMFRKEILDKVNGYRVSKETKRGQDYDLFMRIYAAGGRGANINKILYFYRCFLGTSHKNRYRYRINEAVIRYKGFMAMGLGIISIPYIVKPLILGLFPQKIVDKIAKH